MTFEISDFSIHLDQKAIEGLGGHEGVIGALILLAQAGEAAAKNHAPVDTGNLRRSITHEIEKGDKPLARVGTNVVYAVYQEIGTRHHPANQFLPPAMEGVPQLDKVALRAPRAWGSQ